jgi:hypothetical protein
MSRPRPVRLLALCAAAVPAAAACLVAQEQPAARAREHVTQLDGNDWMELALEQKERLVEGFVLGAAAQQALAAAPGAGATAVDGRELGRAVAELREKGGLAVPFSPQLLARRLDEFYWWRNNRDVPVAGALAEISDRLRREHR